MEVFNPDGWPRPKGYSNVIVAEGKQVHVAGMVGWNPVTEKFETDDIAGQFKQALKNVVAALAAAGGKPEHFVRFTIYLGDADEYNANLRNIGAGYREVMGSHYPVMAGIMIKGFVEAGAKLEIEAYAVIP